MTVLTSLDSGDLRDMGFPQVDDKQLVLDRARRILDAGCDGVVSSGFEISSLRGDYGDSFLIVVPGIRPVENVREGRDDPKRVVDVETAFTSGAVDRPIRATPGPPAAAASFQERIAKVFDRRG
jgi:orotidine-5'-phosphate decarboxylase